MNKKWTVKIPPNKEKEVFGQEPQVVNEIISNLKKTIKMYDKSGRAQSSCENVACELHSYKSKNKECLVLRYHADNIEKVVIVDGVRKEVNL